MEQSKGFVNPEHPDYVYKLKTMLYRLKQTQRSWYERLTNYLLNKGYNQGGVEKTMFIKRAAHVLNAQVYADYIMFGSTSNELIYDFITFMRIEFEMRMMV